jgi:hypothetical protein
MVLFGTIAQPWRLRPEVTTMDTTASSSVMTTAQAEREVRDLNRLIAAAEAQTLRFGTEDWRAYLALKQRRRELKDILLARSIESVKPVVSLKRWRFGLVGAHR